MLGKYGTSVVQYASAIVSVRVDEENAFGEEVMQDTGADGERQHETKR